jgi:mannose-1-phosphate guanylyltransferase
VSDTGHTWALVLAAGEGSRLRSLTTTRAGIAVPKQFCSLCGGPSLLHEALRRAETIADRKRICTIVAQQHQYWWERPLRSMPGSNVVVQPENRGTGNGILLPLLHIMDRDPDARIVLLPSDHHVRDERVLARSLKQAVARLTARKGEIVLLGLEPDEVDPDLGYIVPGNEDGYGAHIVERFVEKPSDALARDLMVAGALWNVFIVAARAQALLDLFSHRYADIVADMRAVVAHDSFNPMEPQAARHLYSTLPDIDFSRHVLQGFESPLRVLAVPPCGWSDLGTPERVARTLRRMPVEGADFDESPFLQRGHLDLAAQHALMRAMVRISAT